jgi:hypothetical protein
MFEPPGLIPSVMVGSSTLGPWIAGLVGVVLGGLLTEGSALLHWRREDRVRFHAVRVEAYARYLLAINEVFDLLARGQGQVREMKERFKLLGEPGSVVRIVASERVTRAADELLEVLGQVTEEASKRGSLVGLDDSESVKAFFDARERLVAAMKKDIGVA